MKVTRRDLLVWSAGAAAGLMVTPVPWKLLDDTSIWSQNWPWIPQPARGPVEVKLSACTLCPNGCGMKVTMAAGWPVGVAGASGHPVSRGALCPLGFGSHQLNWHPRRLRTVRRGSNPSTWNEARTAFAKARSEGPVVVVDGYPGRAASSLLQSFVQKEKGEYRVVLGPEARALAPYEAWSGVPASALGYDLENTQTIVSFGAPLLDGWGPPGRFTRLWAEHAAAADAPRLRLIQVDASLSRTAGRAWQWVKVLAGSESALATGVAGVLLEEHLVSARGPMPPLSIADAAVQTGLSADAIRQLARTIVARTPAVAIASDNDPAVAALNVVLDSVGTRGGIVRRSKRAKAYVSADAPIANARAVLLDASVPWDFTPQTDAEVFRFAAWDGGSNRTDWLLPAPGFLEELTDVPTAPTSARETYAIASGLVKLPHEVHSAAEFLGAADSFLPTTEKIIQSRCEDLFRGHTGTLFGTEETPITKVASAAKLQEQLPQGSVWIGEDSHPATLQCELKQWPTSAPMAFLASWPTPWRAPVLPPLATKLYRESNLREAPEKRFV
jgi:Molybdopterin oxidoreductase Fe4S4 domain